MANPIGPSALHYQPEELTLTTGTMKDGRPIAIITKGGHPQRPGDERCTVLTVALISELPDGDAGAWFNRMKVERPWEARQ